MKDGKLNFALGFPEAVHPSWREGRVTGLALTNGEGVDMGRSRGREIRPKPEANTAFKGLPLAIYFLKISSTSKIAPPAGQCMNTPAHGDSAHSNLTVMFLSLNSLLG